MNIVIYGCDNSGKSSLAMSLEENMRKFLISDVKQVHSLGNVPIEKQIEFMNSELLGGFDVKIFDRFPIIEEEVYGNILRGGSKYDSNPEFKKEMLGKIDLFIYAYPGLTSILNWNGREQMEGVIDNVISIINEYNKLTYNLIKDGYNIIEFNYNKDPNYTDIINDVREVMHEYYRDKI